MNIYCIEGLHYGVFQGLDGDLCKHTFWTNDWQNGKKQPDNVKIMTKEMLEDPDDDFFGATLVQSFTGYNKVKQFAKPIIFYDLMNGRNGGPTPLPWQHLFAEVYNNPYVIPVFISTSCRTSHGMYEGLHKTIYPGIDEKFWNGWEGNEEKIVHVRNSFKERDPQKYQDFLRVCGDIPFTMIGVGGDIECGQEDLREQYRKHRVFVNIEIFTSTFSISSMEAMMTGLPIICNDIESTGEAIRNGVEGFASNNLEYLKKKTIELINDHDMAKELGTNAREMAKIKFSKKQFNLAWDDFLTNIDSYRRK